MTTTTEIVVDHRQLDKEVEYYTKELHKLIGFMDEQTNRRMDYDRLSQVVAHSQRVTELYREIAELPKAVPAPAKRCGASWRASSKCWKTTQAEGCRLKCHSLQPSA